MNGMFSIEFDGHKFTTVKALVKYVSLVFGSWSDVPESHPDYCIIERLAVHNPDFYRVNHNKVVVRRI